jgi:prepilin-type N-terminal cleavage/methylation domain-containing protein
VGLDLALEVGIVGVIRGPFMAQTKCIITTAGRRGFTAVELLVVLGIVTLLTAMTAPAAMLAMSKGAVNRCAEELGSLVREGQQLARRQQPNGPPASQAHYGVVLRCETDGTVSAELLYGSTANDVWRDGTGEAQRSYRLPPGMFLWTAQGTDAATPMAPGESVHWFFRIRGGEAIASPGAMRPITVGTRFRPADTSGFVTSSGGLLVAPPPLPEIPASPVAAEISIRSADNKHAVRLELLDQGLVSLSELSL